MYYSRQDLEKLRKIASNLRKRNSNLKDYIRFKEQKYLLWRCHGNRVPCQVVSVTRQADNLPVVTMKHYEYRGSRQETVVVNNSWDLMGVRPADFTKAPKDFMTKWWEYEDPDVSLVGERPIVYSQNPADLCKNINGYYSENKKRCEYHISNPDKDDEEVSVKIKSVKLNKQKAVVIDTDIKDVRVAAYIAKWFNEYTEIPDDFFLFQARPYKNIFGNGKIIIKYKGGELEVLRAPERGGNLFRRKPSKEFIDEYGKVLPSYLVQGYDRDKGLVYVSPWENGKGMSRTSCVTGSITYKDMMRDFVYSRKNRIRMVNNKLTDEFE